MLGFVPLGGESIRSPNEEFVPFDSQRFGGFEPGLERLLRQLLARTIEQARPGFLCSKSHNELAVWRTGRGSEAMRARTNPQRCASRLDVSPDCRYVYRPQIKVGMASGNASSCPPTSHDSLFTRVLEFVWESPLTVLGTSAGSRLTGFARGWRRSGVARF